LGLTISKNFALLLGGDILVESTLGEGSKFILVFHQDIPVDSSNFFYMNHSFEEIEADLDRARAQNFESVQDNLIKKQPGPLLE
jgi:hypothetical protein